jgi:hypothetical protein
VLVQIVFGLANHHFPYSSETSVSHAWPFSTVTYIHI